MADPRHSYQSPANGGNHIITRWEYASTTARDAESYAATDIGGVARVGSAAPYAFYALIDTTGPAWVQIGSGSGGADADAIHDNVASEISAIIEKAQPHDNDYLLIEDSEASNAKKRVPMEAVRLPMVLAFAEGKHGGTTYHHEGALVFPGTSKVGTPVKAVIAAYVDGSVSTGYCRLYDLTNSTEIVEKSFTNQTNTLIEMGAMTGWSTGEALIEVQLKNNDGQDYIEIYALTLYF